MARSKNQTARREQMVAATIQIIAEEGLQSVRLSRVAEIVGVSARLVSYYYADLESLVEEAHAAAADRYHGSRLRALDHTAEPEEKLVQLIGSGLPGKRDQQLSQVLNELGVDASRSQTHAALMERLFLAEVSLYLGVLQEGAARGAFELARPALEVARNLVSLEDAYGTHLLARSSGLDRKAARNAILGFARVVTGAKLVKGR